MLPTANATNIMLLSPMLLHHPTDVAWPVAADAHVVTALTEATYVNFRRCHSKDMEEALTGCYTTDPEATLRGLPTEALRTHIRAAAASNRLGVVSLLLAKAHTLDDNNPAAMRAHYAAALSSAAQASCDDVVAWLLQPAQAQWLTSADLANAAVLAHTACTEALGSRLFAARLAVLESLLLACPDGHAACQTRGRRVPRSLHGHAKAKGCVVRNDTRSCDTRSSRQWLSMVTMSKAWSPEVHHRYPPAFQSAAKTLLLVNARGDSDASPLPRLPPGVMLDVLCHAARPMHAWVSK